MILQTVYSQIDKIEAMFRAAEASAAYFYSVCQCDPTLLLGKEFRLRDIHDCAEDLDDTYLMRLYAVFEVILRDFWKKGCHRRTHPNAEVLIDRIASARHTSGDDLLGARAVREYRNWLVHGGTMPKSVTLSEGASYLCRYLRYLPISW